MIRKRFNINKYELSVQAFKAKMKNQKHVYK